MFAAESGMRNSATCPGPTDDFVGSVTFRVIEGALVELVHAVVANALAE
jgi:hypothetical protein